MRTLIPALIAVVALVALASCGGGDQAAAPTGYAPNQTAEAYSYVHGGYVGQAVATTDGEGNLSVTLDEAFLPHSLAIVDIESDQWTEDNTATYVIRGNTVHVAKWIAYDGTNYTGTTVGSALVYVESDDQGNPAGNKDLELQILRNERTMRAYFDAIQEGGFQIMTEFGGEPMTVDTTSYGSLTKRGSSYWDERGLTWQGNMEAIEETLVEQGVSYTLNEMSRGDEGTWSVADATTGATASDFPDYFALGQLAIARLDMQ
jgi:hypothetical protein